MLERGEDRRFCLSVTSWTCESSERRELANVRGLVIERAARSAPVDWDIQDFGKDTENIRSRAYDFVMNGWELGSGSIRIHRTELQSRVFEFLNDE